MNGLKLFYSYSHKDESYREELETHLSILRRNGYISEWHDRRISAGSEWEVEINYNLEEADIILLLVSSNFLASDYCYDTETIRALERHESKEAVVIPIILSPCLWLESKFSKLQALPRDGNAISTFQNQDSGWLEVAEGILEKIKSIEPIDKSDVPVRKSQKSESLEYLLLKFLAEFNSWYFSPLRIQKWGARQRGYKEFSKYSTKDIRSCLNEFKKQNKIKTTTSQKGNTIFKIKG